MWRLIIVLVNHALDFVRKLDSNTFLLGRVVKIICYRSKIKIINSSNSVTIVNNLTLARLDKYLLILFGWQQSIKLSEHLVKMLFDI